MSVSGKYLLTPSEGGVICGFVLSLALSYLFIVLSCKGTESLKNTQTFSIGCWVLVVGHRVLVGDEMLWWVIVVGCWLVMKCRCFGDGIWLFVFGVEGPHMLCERPARVVRMVRTSGVEGQMLCYML